LSKWKRTITKHQDVEGWTTRCEQYREEKRASVLAIVCWKKRGVHFEIRFPLKGGMKERVLEREREKA